MNTCNIMHFGAAGDGIADDTAALERALEAARETGCLEIPAGTYRIRPVRIPGHITIRGNASWGYSAWGYEKNKKKVLFFTDAVQAVGHVPIDIKTLHADMLSLSGHKFRAPKGVGALYIKSGVIIKSLIDGGGQERGKRGGTENVASIMGLAKALEIASEEMKDDNARLAMLRDELIYRLTTEIPEAQLTGHPTKRLPGTASFVFKYIEGESLLLMLDAEGICASTGSACSSKSLEPSHVLLAIGLPHEIAHGSLRLTLSHETTKEDIDYIVEKVKYVVQTLRNFSPICPKELKEH